MTLTETKAALSRQKKFKIRIPSTETDARPVSVTVNGYRYDIKRDEVVNVPKSVLEALQNAQTGAYTQKKREDGEGMEMVSKTVQRHPFELLGEAA
ncbi:MAG: hypothetical protein CMI54_08510 [Parcubacteria group bacterium]|jgi:hypothetical protein|nr:hypothetical protein [Parcubacteria group bacterium]|tara:strand:+ start:7764 stop:8051 length:288 start_codon:yes stop_codon:yes gene_type:complete